MLNSFPTLITVTQNDKNYALSFTLQDSSGVVLNLTGATLEFIAQSEDDYPVQAGGAMSITNAAAGQCNYVVQPTDFVVAGTYNVQIAVSFGGSSEVITWNGITINVIPQIPLSN